MPPDEIKAILRGADDLILRGGRALLVKVLKGSHAKDVLKLGLDKNPLHGFYRALSAEDVLARIDWMILHRYLAIEYDGRMPLLVYAPDGWDIEKDTRSDELLREFDEMIASDVRPFNMEYLRDRTRDMIWLLLVKVEATHNTKYIPVLKAWAEVDYRKVRERIRHVIAALNESAEFSIEI